MLRERSPVKHGGSFFERWLEWFWLAGALRRAKQTLPLPSGRAEALALRARSCAEIARQVLGLEMRAQDQAQATANELYRNAAYCALLALSPSANQEDSVSYSDSVWDSLEEILPGLDYGKSLSPALQASLRQGSLRYFAELPAKDQLAIGSELSELVDALVNRAELPERGLTEIYLRRTWHALSLAVLLLAVVLAGHSLYESRTDLAAGRPWRASSTSGDSVGCRSPAQQCGQLLGLFFHTNEEQNPWLEIDLGQLRTISQVELTNRTDCCGDRAQPITIEVSTDHQHFLPVAGRDAEFSTWRARFPAVSARWVRARVLKQTYLHLKRVRIF
ncbi:MAG TPA: discoidin domain-containing protein [Polyangiaceae bacterium]